MKETIDLEISLTAMIRLIQDHFGLCAVLTRMHLGFEFITAFDFIDVKNSRRSFHGLDSNVAERREDFTS